MLRFGLEESMNKAERIEIFFRPIGTNAYVFSHSYVRRVVLGDHAVSTLTV